MSAPPATIIVSTGPAISPIGDEAKSRPQLAVTGPPRTVTTSVAVPRRWDESGGAGEHFQRPGDVEDLSRVEGRDDDRGSFIGVPSIHGRPRADPMAGIVNNVVLVAVNRLGHRLKS